MSWKQENRWRFTWVRISEMWSQRTHRKKRFRDGGRLVGLLRITRGGFVSLLISPRDLKLRLLDAPIRFSSLFFFITFSPSLYFSFSPSCQIKTSQNWNVLSVLVLAFSVRKYEYVYTFNAFMVSIYKWSKNGKCL